MEPARIRYFAMLTLSDSPLPACAYLAALERTGLGVRVLSVFGMPSSPGPWTPHAAAFMAPVAARYVNVVAALPGLPMGSPVTRRDLAGGFGTGGAFFDRRDFNVAPAGVEQMAAETTADGDEVIYQPQTIIAGLYTVGVPNVLLTVPPAAGEISPAEIAAMSKYDVVAVPTHRPDRVRMDELGIGNISVWEPRATETMAVVLENLLAGRKPYHTDGDDID